MSLRFSGFLLDSFEQEYNAVSLSCWTPEEFNQTDDRTTRITCIAQ